MGRIDFSISQIDLAALVLAGVLPLFLAAAARVRPLVGRNALQFLVGFLGMIATWGLVAILSPGSPDAAEIGVALMILASGSLVYLEIWALLSRGYTLGLVLTLLQADGPLEEEELARRYRGGESLGWIMEHRLAGLIGAGLVRREEGSLRLTPIRGVFVARAYGLASRALGLRRAER